MKFVIPDDRVIREKENDKTEITTAKRRKFTEDEIADLLALIGKEKDNG